MTAVRLRLRSRGANLGPIAGERLSSLSDEIGRLVSFVFSRSLWACEEARVILGLKKGVLDSVLVELDESAMEQHRDIVAHLDYIEQMDALRRSGGSELELPFDDIE